MEFPYDESIVLYVFVRKLLATQDYSVPESQRCVTIWGMHALIFFCQWKFNIGALSSRHQLESLYFGFLQTDSLTNIVNIVGGVKTY